MTDGKEENLKGVVAIKEEIKNEINKLNPDKISNYEPQNEELQAFVIDCSGIFSKLYDSLQNMFTDEELRRFDNRISSIKNTSTNRFLKDISELSKNRRILSDVLRSCATKLDKGFWVTTIGRLFVSSLELIDNIDFAFDKKVSKYLIDEAYKYSYKLGLTLHIMFGCVSASAYLSFIPEFCDVMYSQYILRDLMKANQDDSASLKSVQDWFSETEEMDEEVKDLFLYGLDKSFVKDIDRIYRDNDTCIKVFATVFISSLKSNNSILKDIKSLAQMFMFSKSEAGEEWYNRILIVSHPCNFIKNKLECREKIIALSKTAPEIPIDLVHILPKIEISTIQANNSNNAERTEFKLKLKPIPFLMLGTINLFSIYSSFRILLNKEKHLHSDSLRIFAEKANTSLREIEKFQTRYNSDRKRSSIDRPLNI